jgi:hypothetical protein
LQRWAVRNRSQRVCWRFVVVANDLPAHHARKGVLDQGTNYALGGVEVFLTVAAAGRGSGMITQVLPRYPQFRSQRYTLHESTLNLLWSYGSIPLPSAQATMETGLLSSATYMTAMARDVSPIYEIFA